MNKLNVCEISLYARHLPHVLCYNLAQTLLTRCQSRVPYRESVSHLNTNIREGTSLRLESKTDKQRMVQFQDWPGRDTETEEQINVALSWCLALLSTYCVSS